MPTTSTDIFIVHVWRRARFGFASARSTTHTRVCLSQRFARSDDPTLPDRPLKGGRRPLGSKKLPPGVRAWGRPFSVEDERRRGEVPRRVEGKEGGEVRTGPRNPGRPRIRRFETWGGEGSSGWGVRIPSRGDLSHEGCSVRLGRSLALVPREIYPPTICVASGGWIGFVSSEKVLVLQPTMMAKRRETTG